MTTGPLATTDLVALGARTGLLWKSDNVVLAGLGEFDTVPRDGVQDHLGSMRGPGADLCAGAGPVGFAALPFARERLGSVLVPRLVLGESTGVRFATSLNGGPISDIDRAVSDAMIQPISGGPTEITLQLDRPADSWRDDVVGTARDRIARSDLQKAVFARALSLHGNASFPVATIVEDLARRFEHAMVFSIDDFVGASPELLVSRIGRTVRAHPLAGTAARSTDADEDAAQIASLLASSKDRVEHQITIDWLLEELLAFCSYVDAEPEPSVLSLSNVHHLGTLVEGVLSEPAASVLDLVTAVHPTPAVGGNPQDAALELIEELEGFDRQRYAGPAGWVDGDGNGQFAVSVRTAQVDGANATICAGVGVVAQSDPQAELEETQAKFRAMLGSFLPRSA